MFDSYFFAVYVEFRECTHTFKKKTDDHKLFAQCIILLIKFFKTSKHLLHEKSEEIFNVKEGLLMGTCHPMLKILLFSGLQAELHHSELPTPAAKKVKEEPPLETDESLLSLAEFQSTEFNDEKDVIIKLATMNLDDNNQTPIDFRISMRIPEFNEEIIPEFNEEPMEFNEDYFDSVVDSMGPEWPEQFAPKHPLHMAIAMQDFHKVSELLIDSKEVVVDVNKRAEDGGGNRQATPLMWAAALGSFWCLNPLLTAKNLDVNLQDARGKTALDYLAKSWCHMTYEEVAVVQALFKPFYLIKFANGIDHIVRGKFQRN